MKTISLSVAMLACILCTTSCDNDESYHQTLQKASFVEGTTRMFTNKGEVFDTSIINGYIRRFQDDIYMIFKERPSLDDNIMEYNSCSYTITIVSKSQATILYNDGKKQTYKLQRQNGALYFVKDTLETTSFLFDKEWLKFKPIVVKTEPAILGSTKTSFNPTVFAYETNGEIQFPIVSCIVKNIPAINLSQGFSGWYLRQNNSISEEYLAKIASRTTAVDTIVFKESRIVFREIENK